MLEDAAQKTVHRIFRGPRFRGGSIATPFKSHELHCLRQEQDLRRITARYQISIKAMWQCFARSSALTPASHFRFSAWRGHSSGRSDSRLLADPLLRDCKQQPWFYMYMASTPTWTASCLSALSGLGRFRPVATGSRLERTFCMKKLFR